LVSLLENPYLSNEQRSVVAESEQRFKIGQVERARKLIDPIRRKAWGNSKQYGSPEHLANRRRVDLEKPIDVICVVADRLSTIEVPLLGEADRVAFAHRINDACKQLIQLRRRINRGG
jgi:hypothetical protein